MSNFRKDCITVDYKMTAGQTLVAGRAVKLGADTTISAISGTSDKAIGILLEKTARTDVWVPVCVLGVCDAEIGGTVTRGYPVKIDSSGRVVNATPANAEVIIGTALESGTTAGTYVKIVVNLQAMPST